MDAAFDRASEDVGNIVALEHLNVQVPEQGPATLFWISGLGLTRDPYLMTGIDNMWVNVGRSQFHLPTGRAQRLRGRVGLVIDDHDPLLARLARVRALLAGSAFGFEARGDVVDATCPWGNRVRVHRPGPAFGAMMHGMAYVMVDVPPGAAAGIAAFYRDVFGVAAAVADDEGAPTARVPAGVDQWLLFRESAAPIPEYDGHHVQIYVADFSGPYRRLLARGLVSEESSRHQYRFESIVDLASGAPLTRLEHEVRSLRHPLYARPLVNRNAAQNNRDYLPGDDGWRPRRA